MNYRTERPYLNPELSAENSYLQFLNMLKLQMETTDSDQLIYACLSYYHGLLSLEDVKKNPALADHYTELERLLNLEENDPDIPTQQQVIAVVTAQLATLSTTP